MMALIITISVFTSLAATTTVVAATTTTTTISASPMNPPVGQTVTFTVNLNSGSALLNKPVKIWHTLNGVRYEDGTHTTTNGVYSFTQAFSPSGQRVYHAEFAGDSSYGASSNAVTVNVGTTPTTTTTTTISASPTNPPVGQTVTFTVNLKSGSAGLSKSVTIWHTLNGVRYEDGTHSTATDGVYSFTQAFNPSGQRVYHAEFAGDSQYSASLGTETVNVGAAPTTTTTITASPTNPTVGSGITLTVTVKAGATVLTNKQVTVTHTYPGGTSSDGVFDTGSTGTKTFSSGTYGFAGSRVYTAVFAGDSTYASSSGTVTVNVGAAPTTTTTISASPTNPPVGQTVTFTVNLKSEGSGLTKSVKIWHTLNGVRYEDGTHTTTNGVYSFTQAFSPSGQRVYHAEFAGDSSYGASSNAVTVNVGTTPTTTTTTTISASPTNPPVGQTVTFTVNLKSGSAGLSKSVTIWHTLNGVRYEDGTHSTATDGVYSFTQAFNPSGQRVYHAEFAGDSQYSASLGTETVDVGVQ